MTCESSIRSTVKDPDFSVGEDLAEAGAVGGQGDVHVLVEILGRQARSGARRGGFLLGQADDPVEVVLADPDALADRVAIGEELLGDLRSDHDHVGEVEEVGIADEPALGHVLVGQPQEVGIDADDAALDLLGLVPQVLAELAQRRGAGHRGNGLDDPVEVLVGQAVLEDEAVVVLLLRGVDVVDRLGAVDDDVGGAELGDLPLGLGAGPFGDGQHGDHRRHAEDQPQDREQDPELVQASGCAAPGRWCSRVGAWLARFHFT